MTLSPGEINCAPAAEAGARRRRPWRACGAARGGGRNCGRTWPVAPFRSARAAERERCRTASAVARAGRSWSRRVTTYVRRRAACRTRTETRNFAVSVDVSAAPSRLEAQSPLGRGSAEGDVGPALGAAPLPTYDGQTHSYPDQAATLTRRFDASRLGKPVTRRLRSRASYAPIAAILRAARGRASDKPASAGVPADGPPTCDRAGRVVRYRPSDRVRADPRTTDAGPVYKIYLERISNALRDKNPADY